MDNSSDDDTSLVARSYAEVDSRFRYMTGERVDVNKNFARALSLARSDFVAWAAHDDVWDSDFAGVAVESLQSGKDLVIPNWWVGHLERRRGRQSIANPLISLDVDDPIRRLFTYLNLPLRSHKANVIYAAYRRDFLEACQANQSMADDGTFVALALFRTKPEIINNVLFYKHFPHEGGLNGIHAGIFKISRGLLPRSTAQSFRAAKQASVRNLSRIWPEWADLFEEMYEDLPLFSHRHGAKSDAELERIIRLASERVG